jgi:MYXO-CTERM domain-containing protein
VVNVRFGPVADAAPVEEPTESATAAAEPAKAEEPETTEPREDEVEDLLLTQPKKPKGSGCAGCQTEGGAGGSWLWAALGLLWFVRRRRSL